MKVTGESTWIASGRDRHLAAWVHGPQAEPRGLAVIVPPVGRSLAVTYRTLRVLAIRLAEAGFVAVRFEFSGTGDSSAGRGPGTEQDWRDDLEAVLGWSRATWPDAPTVLGVGFELGATFLANSSDPRWGPRLVWDPVSPRKYLRQGSMLRRLSVDGVPRSEGVEHPGFWFSPERVAELNSLRPVEAPAWEPRSTGELPAEREAIYRIDSSPEEGRLLHESPSMAARVPVDRIRYIVEAASELVPGPGGFSADRFVPDRVAHLSGDNGRPLVEEMIEAEDGTLGILTAPLRAEPGDSQRAALLLAGASEPKDGPTGLWTPLSQTLASRGVVAFRAERAGCGDLGDPEALADPNPHSLDIVESARGAAAWLAERTERRVTGIGLCSGAWAQLRAAEIGGFERIVAINNIAWRSDLDFHRRIYEEGLLEVTPEGQQLREDMPETGNLSAATRWKNAAVNRAKNLIKSHAPYSVWRRLGQRGVVDFPEGMLKDVPPTTEVVLVFSAQDHDDLRHSRLDEGIHSVKRHRPDSISTVMLAGLDHSLLSLDSRETATTYFQDITW